MKAKPVKYILNLMIITAIVSLLSPYSLYSFPYFNVIIYAITFLSFALLHITSINIFDSFNKKTIALYLFANSIIFILPIFIYYQLPFVKEVNEIIFFSIFCLLKKRYRFYVYHWFVKILSFVLFIGIIEYAIIILIGKSIILGEVVRNTSIGDWSGIQSVANIYPANWIDIFRFQSLADEPGRIGTLCAFLLFTVDYKFYKKEVIIFIIAGLITFSFAFYIFLVLFMILNIKKRIKEALIIVIMFGVFCYLYGDFVKILIYDRSQQTNIDNRTSYDFNQELGKLYNNQAIFYGMGNRTKFEKNWDGGNAGLKVRLYQSGLIGLFVIFISFSWMVVKYNRRDYRTFMLLIIIWLSFYQRADWHFTPNIILFFAFSLTPIYYNQIKNKNYLTITDS